MRKTRHTTYKRRGGSVLKRFRKYLLSLLLCCSPLFVQTAQGAVRGSPYWTQKGDGWIVYSITTSQPMIAITFDDGPSPQFTPKILQILHHYHAHATFFVIGSVARQYPNLLLSIKQDGHEIGNHTEHHRQLSEVTTSDITMCDKTVQSLTGVRPSLLRPPGGHLTMQFLSMARKTNHKIAMWTWDVDAKDWSRPGVQKIVNTVIKNVDPGDILILHDGGGKRSQTVEALSIILAHLHKDGYQFVTVSELLQHGSILQKKSFDTK